MTPLTAETLPRHELVGLAARVRSAENADLIGIEGTVVAETAGTLTVESDRERQVPKEGTTFAFDLPDSDGTETGGEPEPTRVVVDGDRLAARPARRTETTGDNTWR